MTTENVKTAPNSKESEMMVLGCMLTSINAFSIASKSLDEADFYYTEHKTIFQSLKTAFINNKPADVHLVCEELRCQDKLKAVGGAAYITTLAQYAGTSGYIEEYVEELNFYSQLRQLIHLGLNVEKEASEKKNPSEIVIRALEKLKQIERHKSAKDKFPIKFLDQFDKNFLLVEPSPKKMLLEYANDIGMPIGFLPKGIVAMLVGAGGIGKTHLLAQLAVSIATGTPWLDSFTTTVHCGEEKKGHVFFGLGENQYDDIHRVLYKAAKKLREHQPDILKEDPLVMASKRIAAFSFCGQQAAFLEDKKPSLYFRQLKIRLEEMAPKEGWSLIILDPVSRLMGADVETDNAAATQFIALLEELTIDLTGNPTVLFAHHMNKSAIQAGDKQDQTAARGASALTDGVRWQCNFSKEISKDVSNIAILKMTKSNFTKCIEEIKTTNDFDGFIERLKAHASDHKSKQSVSF